MAAPALHTRPAPPTELLRREHEQAHQIADCRPVCQLVGVSPGLDRLGQVPP
jgi:hypothetical protein